MAMMPIPLGTQSWEDATLAVSAQRLVNWYAEQGPAHGTARTVLRSRPGLVAWTTVGAGPIRGMIEMAGDLYVCSGSAVYRLANFSGTPVELGVVAGTGPVSMAHNGSTVVIAPEGQQPLGVDTTSVTALTDTSAAALPACAGVSYQDGYILLVERGTQKFFISNVSDATTYDPLDFVQVNAYPDLNVGVVNANRETWVFNARSAQVYYNSGDADFPFTRNPSGVVERGAVSSRGIAAYQGTVLWVGDDYRVYASEGYVPRVISNPGVEAVLRADGGSRVELLVLPVYGHDHVLVRLPGKRTLAYDLTTGLWSEWASWLRQDFRVGSYVGNGGVHYVGDVATGAIYTLSSTAHDDDGDAIVRYATSPTLHGGRDRAYMSRFELGMAVGVGLESGQGSSPQVMLEWSDDDGHSWSNELWRSAGAGGDYTHRVIWSRLGAFRRRVLRISMSDPVESVVLEGFADIQPARGHT